MAEHADAQRLTRRRVRLGAVVLAAILLVLTLGGVGRPDETARLEERQARSAAVLIAMEATDRLYKALNTRISNTLQPALREPIYSVGYDWHDVRSRRRGPGEYRVRLTVSLMERCVPNDVTGNPNVEVTGNTTFYSESERAAKCEEQKAILKPLLDEWLLAGCDEPAEFLVVVGEFPTTTPQNTCAQSLLDATSR